jgi:hypothetical protein
MGMSDHVHSQIIDAIGAAELRRAFSLKPQIVWNWRQRGIPVAYRLAVKSLADAGGVALPTDFLAPLNVPTRPIAMTGEGFAG